MGGCFGHVIHIFEPTSGQSFFANAFLLWCRIQEILPEWTSSVPLKSRPVETLSFVALHPGSKFELVGIHAAHSSGDW